MNKDVYSIACIPALSLMSILHEKVRNWAYRMSISMSMPKCPAKCPNTESFEYLDIEKNSIINDSHIIKAFHGL